MIDIYRDNDLDYEVKYLLNNEYCRWEEFYNSLDKDIKIAFKDIDHCTLTEYEEVVLFEIDSGFEVVLGDNIYDREVVQDHDDDDWDSGSAICGACGSYYCTCCGCDCYDNDDDDEDRWDE